MAKLLTFRVQGAPQLGSFVEKLNSGSFIDTRAILDEGAAVLFNRMRTRFLQETSPTGEKWPKSKAALHRAQIGRGGGTLFDTGHLWYSLQLFADSSTTRSIGTNATDKRGFPYPKMHQYGLGGQERREFIGFGQEDVRTMSEVVIRRLVKGLKELV